MTETSHTTVLFTHAASLCKEASGRCTFVARRAPHASTASTAMQCAQTEEAFMTSERCTCADHCNLPAPTRHLPRQRASLVPVFSRQVQVWLPVLNHLFTTTADDDDAAAAAAVDAAAAASTYTDTFSVDSSKYNAELHLINFRGHGGRAAPASNDGGNWKADTTADVLAFVDQLRQRRGQRARARERVRGEGAAAAAAEVGGVRLTLRSLCPRQHLPRLRRCATLRPPPAQQGTCHPC